MREEVRIKPTGEVVTQLGPVATRPPSAALPITDRPALVWLSDAPAIDPDLVGAKASNLATAALAGLPVLPGFVITAAAPRRVGLVLRGDFGKELARAWASLTKDGTVPIVVRSSSPAEDGSDSSMAGMFDSVTNVHGYKAFLRAVDRVLRSASIARSTGALPPPMAVLVQPHLDPRVSGVMFGVDPVTGRADRVTVVAIEGSPEPLVSGEAEGHQYQLAPSGRVLSAPRHAKRLLGLRERRALTHLAQRAATRFGSPQDVEWSFDHDGSLVMFQSRPVTAVGSVATGPVMGPGPVAETFPDPLAPLEIDLWVAPLRSAMETTLRIAGIAGTRRLARSPVVTTVGGRVAADLELLGASPERKRLLQRLNPLPPARKLGAAWRVGRLTGVLPSLGKRLSHAVDLQLARVPDPSELTNEQLLNVLLRSQRTLVSLHGYEVLSGLLESDGSEAPRATAVGAGLDSLALGRVQGLDDADLVASSPEVLALLPPSIGVHGALPAGHGAATGDSVGDMGARESLKLRIRWVQELSARCARELGRRLVPAGALDAPEQVSRLSLDELASVVAGGAAPEDLSERAAPASPPLPSAFRLTPDGIPIAVRAGDDRGTGAGGGRAMGRVHQGRVPEHGDVLVVQALDPALAHLLPTLGGLVAETGNVLSHLAILAREFGVPTVVGVAGARERFTEDTVVVVDGSTGEVSAVKEEV